MPLVFRVDFFPEILGVRKEQDGVVKLTQTLSNTIKFPPNQSHGVRELGCNNNDIITEVKINFGSGTALVDNVVSVNQ